MSQPKIIKRYQNRKLYDTESSRYVTLEDIAEMIKSGDDVKVIDNKTKEDLTSVTLTQIIYEEEKKKKSILPLDALKKVIRSSGESLSDIFERVIQDGASTIHSARAEVEKLVGRLVKRGRLDPEEGKGLLDDLKDGSSQMQRRIESSWQQATDLVKGLTILARQVDQLERHVEELEQQIAELKAKGVIKN